MSKPIIQIGNEQREMTDAELTQWQADVAELQTPPPKPDVDA